MSRRLAVAVPDALLGLAPEGGHGKVWHRVLAILRTRARIVSVGADSQRARGRVRRRPDVVLASGHDELPAVSAPLVVQVHEAGWFEPALRETLDPAFLERIEALTAAALRSAARVITPSEAGRRDLIAHHGLDPARVHAVHHGADELFFGEPGAARLGAAIVSRARGGREAPYVLYAGTLHPRKNVPALREAISAIADRGLPHVLVIAGGDAPDRKDSAALEAAASAELPGAPDRVVRLRSPPDRDLAALMAGAGAFCLPSLYEGFGLTALEAMAAGAPVLVSNRGALPEVVGDAGLLCEPTAESIATSLERLLGDEALAAELRGAGPARARAFTWERTADGWLDVLRAAASA